MARFQRIVCGHCHRRIEVALPADTTGELQMVVEYLDRRALAIEEMRAKLRAERNDPDRDGRMGAQYATLRQTASEIRQGYHIATADPIHHRLCTCPTIIDVVVDGATVTTQARVSKSCELHGVHHASLRTPLGTRPRCTARAAGREVVA